MSPTPLQPAMVLEPPSTTPTDELKMQWTHPGDVFSLLLLVGGDVVQKAIARLAGFQVFGGVPLAPVCFSFGWVAYAFTMIATAAGKLQLMPPPDCTAQVINAKNGFARDNCSWVLGRLMRDKDLRVKEFDRPDIHKHKRPRDSSGKVLLMIDLFDSTVSLKPQPSRVWVMSIFMIIAQLAVAAIPWIKYNNYTIFMFTAIGSVLALLSAAVPQWKAEQWSAARVTASKDTQVLLTRGNGHQYAMLVRCKAGAWNLETMATGRPVYCQGTRWCLWLLAALWTTLFFTTLGMKHDTWYLFGVGIMGMVQNTFVAAYPCTPEELDIVLTPDEKCPTIVGYQRTPESKETYLKQAFDKARDIRRADDPATEVRDVMGAIMELGKRMPEAGKALLPIFFPRGEDALRDYEKEFWQSVNPE